MTAASVCLGAVATYQAWRSFNISLAFGPAFGPYTAAALCLAIAGALGWIGVVLLMARRGGDGVWGWLAVLCGLATLAALGRCVVLAALGADVVVTLMTPVLACVLAVYTAMLYRQRRSRAADG